MTRSAHAYRLRGRLLVACAASAIVLAAVAGCTGSSAGSTVGSGGGSAGGSPASTAPEGATAPSGSGGTSGLPAYTQTLVSMGVDGEQRRYLLEAPTSGAKDRPLIIFMHGAGNSPAGVAAQIAFSDGVRKAGAILVLPEGDPVHHSWRAGCCGPWADSPNDFDFITQIIHSLVSSGQVDPAHVALGGFSVGALFANTFACRYPTMVRGVLAIAGALLEPPRSVTHGVEPGTPRCEPSRPITALELHGSIDPSVPLNGTLSDCVYTPCMIGTPGYLPSATAVDSWWRTIDDCAAPTRRTSFGATVQLAHCAGGASVGLAVVPGITHDLAGLVARFPVHATLLALATGAPLTSW